MKQIISVSLGAREADYEFETEFLGQQFMAPGYLIFPLFHSFHYSIFFNRFQHRPVTRQLTLCPIKCLAAFDGAASKAMLSICH